MAPVSSKEILSPRSLILLAKMSDTIIFPAYFRIISHFFPPVSRLLAILPLMSGERFTAYSPFGAGVGLPPKLPGPGPKKAQHR